MINQVRFVLFAWFTLVLAGCAGHGSRTASFGSSQDLLGYGVYTAQAQDSAGMSVKLSLNQNGTYSKKRLHGNCLVLENKGEWKSDNENITFHMTEVRKRPDCTAEDWQVEKVDKSAARMIRNMTVNSFELLDQEEQSSAEWIRFVKR